MFVNMTARRRDIYDRDFLLLAGFVFAAGSEDGPARKRRKVWSLQQHIERPLLAEH